MESRKVIVIDEVIERVLANICNAALKYEGLPMIGSVNAVKDAIKEEGNIEEKK